MAPGGRTDGWKDGRTDGRMDGHGQTYINASLTILDVHQCLIEIYICSKFHEIRLWGYLVIDNYMEFKSIQGL